MERLLAVQQALHNASTTRSLEKDDSSSSSSSSESNGPSAYTAAMQATLSRLGLCAWHIYCTLHAARCTLHAFIRSQSVGFDLHISLCVLSTASVRLLAGWLAGCLLCWCSVRTRARD
jgi:hypothetical protein